MNRAQENLAPSSLELFLEYEKRRVSFGMAPMTCGEVGIVIDLVALGPRKTIGVIQYFEIDLCECNIHNEIQREGLATVVHGLFVKGTNHLRQKAVDCIGCTVQPALLVVIDLVEVMPDWRGQNIGLRALRCFMRNYRHNAGTLIALHACPLNTRYRPGHLKMTKRLKEHYAKIGFVEIPKSRNVMACWANKQPSIIPQEECI